MSGGALEIWCWVSLSDVSASHDSVFSGHSLELFQGDLMYSINYTEIIAFEKCTIDNFRFFF